MPIKGDRVRNLIPLEEHGYTFTEQEIQDAVDAARAKGLDYFQVLARAAGYMGAGQERTYALLTLAAERM